MPKIFRGWNILTEYASKEYQRMLIQYKSLIRSQMMKIGVTEIVHIPISSYSKPMWGRIPPTRNLSGSTEMGAIGVMLDKNMPSQDIKKIENYFKNNIVFKTNELVEPLEKVPGYKDNHYDLYIGRVFTNKSRA